MPQLETTERDLFDHSATASAPARKPRSRQAELGQYLTGDAIAAFMASLFPKPVSEPRLLDAGAGKGALIDAFVRHHREKGFTGPITAHAYELDQHVLGDLLHQAAGLQVAGVDMTVIEGDFVQHAVEMLRLQKGVRYSHAILNPPYKKIGTSSRHRALLSSVGLETVNLYSGFVGLCVALLEHGGELVAIIPRSFCNGPYYQPFRRFVLERGAIQHIHLFEARNKAFSKDGVLQENVIIRLTRGAPQGDVTVSTSANDSFADYEETRHPFTHIVLPDDRHQFIHIPTGDAADLLASPAFCHRLEEIGLSVSTGPVVDFRMRADLRSEPERGTVPLLYPGHFTSSGLEWPKIGFKKPNAIRYNADTRKWLFPSGFYAVVRRFSSKEERRRIVANVVDPAALQAEMIGFENHLNVIHYKKRPLSKELAFGVSVYLNSTFVDHYFRRFNGHTQVNAADLKMLPYPSQKTLLKLGKWLIANTRPSQEAIDAQIAKLV